MGPEAKVKLRVKKLLKKHNAFQFWPVQTGYGSPALDCYGSYCGLFFAVETKAPGKHPTARQVLIMKSIEAAGGAVFVVGGAYSSLADEYLGMVALEGWLLLNAKPEQS